MAKKTRTELSTLALNTNLPDNTTEQITPTTERSQLTDERESVVNYKDDLGGATNAGKFLTVATDGESLTMVDEPSGVPDWVTFLSRSMRLFTSAASSSATIEWTYLDADDALTIGGTIKFFRSNKALQIKNEFQGETMKMSGGDIIFMLEGEQLFRIRLLELTHYGDDFNMIAQDVFGASPLYNLNFKGRIDSSSNRYTFSSISGGKENVTEDDKAGFLSFKTGIADGTLTERLRISSGGAATFENNIIGKNTVKVQNDGYREYQFLTSSGSLRWSLYSLGGNETGSDAGSNLDLARYNDSGGYAGGVLNISRATGVVSIPNGIVFNNNSVTGDKTNVTLNAYEEGTWTPTNQGTSNITIGPTALTGTYTRIGNRVMVDFKLSGITAPYTGALIYIVLAGFPFVQNTNLTISNGVVKNYPNSRQAGGIESNSGGNNSQWFVYWTNTISNQSNNVVYGTMTYQTS